MEIFAATARISFLTLLSFELILLSIRAVRAEHKKDLFIFMAIIVVLGIKVCFSRDYLIGIVASLLLIFTTGTLLRSITGVRNDFLWNASIAAVVAVLVLVIALRLYERIYFPLFYFAIMGIAFIYPLFVMYRLYKYFRSGIFIYIIVATSVLILARGLDVLTVMTGFPFIDLTVYSSIILLLGTGYMIVFEERVFNRVFVTGSAGASGKRVVSGKWIDSIFSRLARTEKSLLLQDRLAASGILAIGALHEFKNIITNLGLLCEYGIGQADPEKKHEALVEALESTDQAKGVVRKYLDTAALEIDEKKETIDIGEDLRPLILMLGVHFRRKKIQFIADIEPNVRVRIGRGELEQTVLNLVRNSADAFSPGHETEKKIRITARTEGDHAVIDFLDNGQGIPEHFEKGMFTPRSSLKGGSGLGLALVRLLVERNGGSIEYHPAEAGARFRVTLPAAV